MHNYTVKDSSIWGNSNIQRAVERSETRIRIGIVQSESYNVIRDETIYMVNMYNTEGQHIVPCIRMVRFGSPFNYEEYTRQTYESEDGNIENRHELRYLPGETVVVAYINGGRSNGMTAHGIILGSINHPYRRETLKRNNEVAYISEFNGIETYISKSGEYRQTYRGIQKNIDKLREPPDGKPLPEPEYDFDIGSGYTEWDKTGSWHVTDNASDDLKQSIKINKKDGKIEIISGDITLTLDKNDGSYSLVNKITSIESEESVTIETKKTEIKSTDLFDLEAKDIKTKGKWKQEGDTKIDGNTDINGNMNISGNTDQTGNISQTGNLDIMGNISNTGTVSLAGGAKPLMTDIIVIIGTGNLGAPVVSNATVLVTTLTKAT